MEANALRTQGQYAELTLIDLALRDFFFEKKGRWRNLFVPWALLSLLFLLDGFVSAVCIMVCMLEHNSELDLRVYLSQLVRMLAVSPAFFALMA